MNEKSSDAKLLICREIEHRPDDLEILERFYNDIYVAEFPIRDERESLQNMRNYLRLKATGWYGRNSYHILMGFNDGNPVAGALSIIWKSPIVQSSSFSSSRLNFAAPAMADCCSMRRRSLW